tara:strand:+ start:479 stop:826 length:348 start_codon:yes stop_codon:yes gene_type:complete
VASTFKNQGATLGISDGSGADIYTAGGSVEAVIHAIYISNTSTTNTINVNVQVTTDGGSTFYYVLKSGQVNVNNTLVLDKPINLESNDKIKIWVDPLADSSTPSAEVFMSILEVS